MKQFILTTLLALVLLNCGGSRNTDDENNQTAQIDDTAFLRDYPNVQAVTTDSDANTSDELNTSTLVTTTGIIVTALKDAGYEITLLDLSSPFRGELDYDTYMYLTNQSSTIAVLGDYVYALKNPIGERILFTINGPSEFDAMEASSEIVLRADFTPESATFRYNMVFIPTGFVNINTTKTNPEFSIATLLAEIRHAFTQLTLTNPQLTKEYLNYYTDTYGENSYILCNNKEYTLDVTQQTVSLSDDFLDAELVHCTTSGGVLIGSIYTPTAATAISGDLFKTIYANVTQLEGLLSTDKEEVNFVATQLTGSYGTLELLSDGNWLYRLDITNSTIQALDTTQSLSETFEIAASDATKATITITIHGVDTIATLISGDLFKSISEITSQIEGVLTTNDEALSFIANQISGTYGSFKLLEDGSWIYTLNIDNPNVQDLGSGESLSESFSVATSDNTTATVEISITGIPTAIEGTIAYTIPKDFTGSVNGNLVIKYSSATLIPMAIESTYGFFSLEDNWWYYYLNYESVASLQAGESVVDTFTVSTTDNTTQDINITIEGSDTMDNPTDFSGIVIYNEYMQTSSTMEGRGAKLKGTISDADGLASIEILYGDGTKSIQTDSLSDNATEYTLYNEEVYPFGTTFTITVVDSLGNETSYEGTLLEQNEQTQFYKVMIEPAPEDTTKGRVVFDLYDDNGLESVTVEYSDGTATSEYLDLQDSYLSSNTEPGVTYGSTFTIKVVDALGNTDSFSGIVEVTPDYAPDFSALQIGTNDDGTRYLYGSISDQNGIASIYIDYGNGIGSDYIMGGGDKTVELTDLGSYPAGTTFEIYVYDIQGNYPDQPYTGTL